MQTKTETTNREQTEPRKLSKPVREEPEMKREELVTYTSEAGGGGPTTFFITT